MVNQISGFAKSRKIARHVSCFLVPTLAIFTFSHGWCATPAVSEKVEQKKIALKVNPSLRAKPPASQTTSKTKSVVISKKTVTRTPTPLKNKSATPAKKKTEPDLRISPSKPVLIPTPISKHPECLPATPASWDFDLPTDNHMLFSKVSSKIFFQPTTSERVISAMFGCVRNPSSSGIFTRFHEGVDIRPIAKDEHGEPLDDVYSAGDGKVVYVCRHEKNSNYGKYIVVEHQLHGPAFYTLYAHLASVENFDMGEMVEKGQKLGVLGRTSNEYEIEHDHAHLHFEVDMMANHRYDDYGARRGTGYPNHGLFNGSNLIGIDPVRFFQYLQTHPDASITDFIKRESIAFKILVPVRANMSWIQRYPTTLVPTKTKSPQAYEISMTYYGLPVKIEPQSKDALSSANLKSLSNGMYPVVYANTKDLRANPACKLVEDRGSKWGLTEKGYGWVRQLLY